MGYLLPQKEELLALAQGEFAKLEPKEAKPLSLPSFNGGGYHDEFKAAREYVLQLLKGSAGSPIFHFVVSEDMSRLDAGAAKWVGAIPRELPPQDVQNLATSDARNLAKAEKERVGLDEEETGNLQKLIRNTLIASLHSGLKAAAKEPALNAALGGDKNFISYMELEEKARILFEAMAADTPEEEDPPPQHKLDATLIQLLKELGVLNEDAKRQETEATLDLIREAQNEAWKLYHTLGENTQEAQTRAKIPGNLAKIDWDGEHENLHFLEHLRAMYGQSPRHGKRVEDRFELQTTANLTWLMARLLTHPVFKTLKKHKAEVVTDFTQKIYGEKSALFRKNPSPKTLYLDERKRLTSPGDALWLDHYEVYDSLLPGFEHLSDERKQIYRGEKLFRPKEALSIFIKALKDKQELGNVSDLLAGEGVAMGIDEKDLDPHKSTNAKDYQNFMFKQAEAIAQASGLKEAPSDIHYSKIPRGTFKVVPKLTKDPKNTDSFNFPAVKIYFNWPVGEESEAPDAPSIRTEYRLVCRDTWLRANKQTDSMSHHKMYKLKQSTELIDILSARLYNGTIHPVVTQFKEWCNQEEQRELKELMAA